MTATNFFTNQTANGDSVLYQGLAIDQVRPCPLDVYFTGTFGGASVAAYATVDGTNWLLVPGVPALVAPGIMQISITADALKFTLTGATGTTNISAATITNI